MLIDLNNYKFDKNDYFTIGGKNVEKANIKIPNYDITWSEYYKTNELENFIPNAEHLPAGLALLYKPEGFKFFTTKLTNTKSSIKIDNDYKKSLIRDYIRDLVVYGNHAHATRCNIFEEIYPDFKDKDYMIRYINIGFGIELSINRCTASINPFIPEAFKFGKPTPSDKNDCSLEFFSIDNRIERFTPALITIDISNPPTCSSNIDPSIYASVDDHLIANEIDILTTNAEFDTCGTQLKYSTTNKDLDVIISIEKTLSAKGHTIIREWDQDIYRQEWDKEIEKNSYLLPMNKIRTDKNIRSWFEYIPHEDHSKSRYRCNLCYKYHDMFRLASDTRSKFADEEGFDVSTNVETNRNRIITHYDSAGHQGVIAELIKIEKSKLTADLLKIENLEILKYPMYAATARMFRTVYAELLSNIPFISHPTMVDLQNLNGIEVGKYYTDPNGAKLITESISTRMHENLIKHILSQSQPISIIVDTSTDKSNHHYISVLLQTLVNGRVNVFFYKVYINIYFIPLFINLFLFIS